MARTPYPCSARRACLLACGVLLAPGTLPAQQVVPSAPSPGSTLHVPARDLPLPTTVSEALRGILAASTPSMLVVPTEPSALRAMQARVNAAAARAAALAWREHDVTVTPTTLGGVRAFVITPSTVAHPQRRIVALHGGAYLFQGGEGATLDAAVIARATETIVIAVDYRMPPDHPHPAAVDDVVAVWRAVVAERPAEAVGLLGLSAGGGLAMSTVLALISAHVPRPAAVFLGSPWADLSKTGDSYFTSAGVDHVLVSYDQGLADAARWYAGGRALTDAQVSPVYADLRGFPPTMLISGTRDLFLSLTVRTHRALRQAGVEAELHVFEGQAHGAYMLPTPERHDALREVAAFFDRHLRR